MTTTTFLMLLSSFSVLSGLVTEGIKKLISDKANMSYNIIALVVALVIGGAGSAERKTGIVPGQRKVKT